MADLLLEIGLEEVPARMIQAAAEELQKRVGDLLKRERLVSPDAAAPMMFDTPRRLAVAFAGVAECQPDLTEQILGPSVKVAFKDGAPTPAAHAFAKKVGLDIAQIERVTNPKGEYLAANVRQTGRNAATVLAEALPKELNSLYWPKSMYWREPGERFVRPVRWLVAMLDERVISLEFDGVVAGSASRSHRQKELAGMVSVPLQGASSYVQTLRGASVLSRPERTAKIRKDLDAVTRTIPGAHWREDAALLDIVVNLCEFPSVILGTFEPEYLTLPEEVLVTVMRDHQCYFALEDSNHRLLPHFLAVLNRDGDPHGLIVHGHERVLRARFNDARFFYNFDQKHSLQDRVKVLQAVTFQKDLGSYYEKSQRMEVLAEWICKEIAAHDKSLVISAETVKTAARLAKTDLTCELVKEFTELQGVIGGLYAEVQGEGKAVGSAIYDQYRPAGAEDEVPRTLEGAVLAIADKADSIAGMFRLGLTPSGSKDPFALRRQANGIVRIVAEKSLPLPLSALMLVAMDQFAGSPAYAKFAAFNEGREKAADFFRERLEFYLRDAKGYAYDVVKAVLAAGADDVSDAVARAEAVSAVRSSADFAAIAASFKRIKNILRQADENKFGIAPEVNAALLKEEAESILFAKASETAHASEAYCKASDYVAALREISQLRPALDRFFDQVMVMTEDLVVRANRLAVLRQILHDFSTIADFSEVVVEGSSSDKKL